MNPTEAKPKFIIGLFTKRDRAGSTVKGVKYILGAKSITKENFP